MTRTTESRGIDIAWRTQVLENERVEEAIERRYH
jgi:hypothetical protein